MMHCWTALCLLLLLLLLHVVALFDASCCRAASRYHPPFMALNSLCVDVPLRNYSLTRSQADMLQSR